MAFWQLWSWWTSKNNHKQQAKKKSNLQFQDVIGGKKYLNQARTKKKKNDNERIELPGLKTCLNYPDLLKEIAVTLDTVLSSW